MELSKVGLGGGLPRKCIHVHQNGEFEHGRGKSIAHDSPLVRHPPVRCVEYCLTQVCESVYWLARAVLYVQPEWDMDALLNAVSNRLEIVPSARRLFNSDGMLCEPPPLRETIPLESPPQCVRPYPGLWSSHSPAHALFRMHALRRTHLRRLGPVSLRLSGIEIEDVLMIEDGAIVFVSSGTDFIVPAWDKRETPCHTTRPSVGLPSVC